ncbi:hypothetical protein JG687_00003687 [Phytophthora cactorum]|uniref:Uncharacterized protein n=1 Tax=Phytophthora cactorum TaxID=29920 RepID=A0A8T1UTP3_9STRA|nr:hypothetical protein GQ600_17700 [Phytophthora cactorum]KAG6968524.1 hypothetical protein JG687_00003687 [Phytophthora cactorum]
MSRNQIIKLLIGTAPKASFSSILRHSQSTKGLSQSTSCVKSTAPTSKCGRVTSTGLQQLKRLTRNGFRTLKTADKSATDDVDEIGLNFSLKNRKKNVPGTGAFKAAAGARAVAAQAKKAEAAAKKLKMQNLFKFTYTRVHQHYPTFQEMRVMEKARADVIQVVFAAMKTRGWSKDQATVIGNRYYDCSSLLTSKITAFGKE